MEARGVLKKTSARTVTEPMSRYRGRLKNTDVTQLIIADCLAVCVARMRCMLRLGYPGKTPGTYYDGFYSGLYINVLDNSPGSFAVDTLNAKCGGATRAGPRFVSGKLSAFFLLSTGTLTGPVG